MTWFPPLLLASEMVSSVPFQRLDMVYLESNSNLLVDVINGVLDAPINIMQAKKSIVGLFLRLVLDSNIIDSTKYF